jgi:hypothetical protein
MEERANIFEGGIDRVQSAWTSVEDEFEKLQKRVEKETEKQVKWLRKTPLAKRVESFREDATRQLEANFENFLGLLPVASQSRVKRLERRVSQLTRKLNALEKAQTSSQRAKSPTRGTRGVGAADAGQAAG